MSQTEAAKAAQDKLEQDKLAAALQSAVAPINQAVNQLAQEVAVLKQTPAQPQPAPEEDVSLKELMGNLDTVDDTDDKYDNLSNRQILDVVSNSVEAAMAANNEQIKTELTGTIGASDEKIGQIQQTLMAITAGLGLKEVQSKHPDFNDFKEDVAQVVEEYPGMKWDDAYMLAKSRKAGTVPPASVTDREKPGSSASPVAPGQEHPGTAPTPGALAAMAERGAASRGGPSHSGIVGFRGMVDQQLDSMLADR